MSEIKLTLDEQIEQLKLKIETLKQTDKPLVFKPITSCKITWLKIDYNINTLNKEELYSLLGMLVSIQREVQDDFTFSGYFGSDWISDIKSKIQEIDSKEKRAKIKQLEISLDALVSEDKRKQNQLSSIAETLAQLTIKN